MTVDSDSIGRGPGAGGDARQGEGGRLIGLCVDQPEAAALALSAAASVEQEGELFERLSRLPSIIAELRAAAEGVEGGLVGRLLDAVERLIADDRVEDAGHALALAAQVDAKSQRVQSLTKGLQDRILQAMRQAVSDGDDRRAYDLAQTLVGMAPASSEGWLTAGRMLLKFGRPREALAALRQAARHGQSSQNALLNLARAEIRCGLEREGMLTLFKLLRIAEADDGRYTPLALAELDTLFASGCARIGQLARDGDLEELAALYETLSEVARRRSGSLMACVIESGRVAATAAAIGRAALALGDGRQAIGICEAAIAEESDHSGLWSLLGRLHLHFHENREAAEAFRRSLALKSGQASVFDGLAEALFRMGADAGALEAAERALAANGTSETVRARKESIEARLRAAARAPSQAESGRRILTLVGMPDPGQALLGIWLSQVQGTRFVGESIWVGGREPGASGIGLGGGAEARFASCQLCHSPDCAVFDMAFRRELSDDPVCWYQRLAARLDCELLVCADNSPNIVRRLDPLKQAGMIVAFRSPPRAWAAFERSYRQAGREAPPVQQFLQNWSRLYLAALHDDGAAAPVFVDLDDFFGGPEACVEALLDALDLGGLPRDRQAAAQNHLFGVDPAVLPAAEEPGASPLYETFSQLGAVDDSLLDRNRDAREIHEELVARKLQIR